MAIKQHYIRPPITLFQRTIPLAFMTLLIKITPTTFLRLQKSMIDIL